jgi:S1-C subfamily serine protease
MKYIYCLCFVIVFLCGISNAEENTDKSTLIENTGKSVVQISIALKIDSTKIEHADLFRKLETEFKHPILNHYYGALLGSGFIISEDGYVISNMHVTKYIAKKQAEERLRYKLMTDMYNKLIPGILSEEDIRQVFKDLNKYMGNTTFTQIVTTFDGNIYEVSIIKENQTNDLSLLKIRSDEKFLSLSLNTVDNSKVGQEVYAMGFPGSLDSLFSETKVTFTSGVISAIRNDTWGIQHTANINYGNSGGPLLDQQQKVIGVNVAMVPNSNGLFFSVPVEKLVQWLVVSGYGNIIKKD